MNKVAIVTGAGGGIGGAIARRFVRDGMHVILSDIRPTEAQQLADELGQTFVTADVAREGDVAALIDAAMAVHGRLDVMVNNAGIAGAIGSLVEISDADWSRTIAVLLNSVFYGMKHAARVMIPQGQGGAILSTTSIAGIVVSGPHAYTAAKHAVVGLTKSGATELASHGIRVNAVAPGFVPSLMTAAGQKYEDAARGMAARSRMNTAVSPDEIAGAFAYLASDDARTLTGQVITVDAGVVSCPLDAPYFDFPATFAGVPS